MIRQRSSADGEENETGNRHWKWQWQWHRVNWLQTAAGEVNGKWWGNEAVGGRGPSVGNRMKLYCSGTHDKSSGGNFPMICFQKSQKFAWFCRRNVASGRKKSREICWGWKKPGKRRKCYMQNGHKTDGTSREYDIRINIIYLPHKILVWDFEKCNNAFKEMSPLSSASFL